jgi:hypothetical protein
MTTAIKRRRGTTTQHATFTGLEGELTVDTTKDTVVVHDGATAGGFPLAKESQVTTNVAITGGSISGITDLAVADGGTGASTAGDARTNLGVTATGADTTYAFRANNLSDLASASTARTNLGLGTAATVADSSLVHIAGTETITGAKTFSTAPVVAGLSNSANLTFTGTGNRITGDFTSSPIVNRTYFQTSAANTTTVVGVLPSGTGVTSRFAVYNNSDPTNASQGDLSINSTEVSIRSTFAGTGTFLPITMYTGGSERLRLDTSGNVGIGTSSPASIAKLAVSNLATSENGSIGIVATGYLSSFTGTFIRQGDTAATGTTAGLSNANLGQLAFQNCSAGLISTNGGSPLVFGTSAAERMRIDSVGNLGIGTSSPASFTGGSNGLAVSINGNSGMAILRNAATSGVSFDQLQIGVAQGASANYHFIRCYHSVNTAATPVHFVNGNGDGYFAGNVGIGTSSPAVTLDVNKAGGQLRVSDGTVDMRMLPLAAGNAGIAGTWSNHSYILYTNNAERMRIDSSGNVGIGISNGTAKLTVAGAGANNAGAAATFIGSIQINEAGSFNLQTTGGLEFKGSVFGAGYGSKLFSTDAGDLLFGNRANSATWSERMRIDSSGNLLVGATSPATASTNTIVGTSTGGTLALAVVHNAATDAVRGLVIQSPNYSGNDGYSFIVNAGGNDRLYIRTSGNVQNTNNSYGAISDVKLKENIVDATPKLEKLMQVKVRSYNLKTEPNHKQIGVVAQELEEVFPGLIEESKTPDQSDTIKTVKYSVFVPMLIKAIQELKATVDAQAARIAALESN